MYEGKNRYYKNSKSSEARFRRLMKAFALDLTTNDVARLTGISTRSVNAIYLKTRQRIAEYCEAQSPYSVYSSVMVMWLPRSYRMQRKRLY